MNFISCRKPDPTHIWGFLRKNNLLQLRNIKSKNFDLTQTFFYFRPISSKNGSYLVFWIKLVKTFLNYIWINIRPFISTWVSMRKIILKIFETHRWTVFWRQIVRGVIITLNFIFFHRCPALGYALGCCFSRWLFRLLRGRTRICSRTGSGSSSSGCGCRFGWGWGYVSSFIWIRGGALRPWPLRLRKKENNLY